jgi:hypothetical protein
MENMFVLALIISIVFVIVRFIEMRFIVKEDRPLKDLFKEGIQVYLSSVFGLYIATQFDVLNISNKIQRGGTNVSVFVDNPDF